MNQVRRTKSLYAVVALLGIACVNVYAMYREARLANIQAAALRAFRTGDNEGTLRYTEQILNSSGGISDRVQDALHRATTALSRQHLNPPAANRVAYAHFLRGATWYRRGNLDFATACMKQMQAGQVTRERARLLLAALDWNKRLSSPVNEEWLRRVLRYKG